MLVCVIPILIAAWVLTKPGIRRKLLVATLVLAAAALVLSYARGAWLALVAGAVLFWMLRRRMLVRGYLLVLLGAGLSLYVLIDNDRYMRFAHDHDTTTFHTNFSEHLQATYQFKDVSTAERFYRWIAGVRMIEHNWATGWGPQTFSQNYQRYTIPAFRTWVSDNKDQSTVHNYYLTTIIEQGAAGLLILLVFIGYGLHAGQRIYHESKEPLWRAAGAVAAVILGMQCTFNALNDLVETDKLGSLFYLAIAVLIAGEVHLRKQGEQEAASDSPAQAPRIS
ncbi:MAG: O-antigen ligase domain-containing protein [Chitinophagaceae bacterium]|nr:MAG: O-antigen ligase domain-containing protein [Chitinophagaceae bacterium]